jgi:hypothetical protein
MAAAVGVLRCSVTVRPSAPASTALTTPSVGFSFDEGARVMSSAALAAAASSFVPSWNVRFGRSLNENVLGSTTFQLAARFGTGRWVFRLSVITGLKTWLPTTASQMAVIAAGWSRPLKPEPSNGVP